MPENQDQLDLAKKNITEMLGGDTADKKEEVKGDAKTDVVVEEKKVEGQEEKKIDGEGEEGQEVKKVEGEEESSVIKITAKQTQTKEEEKVTTEEDDIDDEKLLKLLSKKSGKEIKSLDEILNPQKELTEEDKIKAKEQRDSNKIAFGLQNGFISEKKLTKYFADSKNKKDLVFEQYWQEQSAEDKTLTKAQAEIEFNEKFHLDAEEDSRNYKRGMKEIEALGTQILHNEYPEIFELERKYSDHESTITSTQQKEATILQNAPKYKKDVEDAFSEIKSIKVKRDNEEFEIEFDKSVIEPYMKQALQKEYAEKKILGGWSKDEMKVQFQGAALLASFDEIAFGLIDQALLKREKGLKGVEPKKNFNAKQEDAATMSQIDKAKADIKSMLQGANQRELAAN